MGQLENLNKMIALVDVNNFYVSCERLFNPQLRNKPVVVLSNNDGCIISRSQEAKELGIKMGQPLFKATTIIKKNHVQVLSSNYAFYADISNRVMTLLSEFTDIQEIYSIDECFLNMHGYSNLHSIANEIKQRLWRYLRMPVCVGIGPTKVLAKLANRSAKKEPHWKGVFITTSVSEAKMNKIMDSLGADELWGIGRALSLKLKLKGVHSILALKKSSPIFMRKKFSINMEKIIYELNGISCFMIERNNVTKKEIRSSRSFGRNVTNYRDLEEAITTFVSRAAFKARSQNTVSGKITIFVTSNPFNKNAKSYGASIDVILEPPTLHTRTIVRGALRGLKEIYKENINYAKCGVILSNLTEVSKLQDTLVWLKNKETKGLTEVIDKVNNRFNKHSIRPGTQPLKPAWGMKQSYKSQAYTTSWDSLLKVN